MELLKKFFLITPHSMNGQTTLVFAIAGTSHYVITNQPNEPRRINEYCRKIGIKGDLHFLLGSSDTVFSNNGVIPEILDFVFIDGGTGSPSLPWTGIIPKASSKSEGSSA